MSEQPNDKIAERSRGRSPLSPALSRGPAPFYHQIRAIFREKIANGELRPGDRLPSEEDICRSFKVSRATVRQALQGLDQGGLIRREPGRGSFVREAPETVAQLKMTCLLEDLIALGIPAETQVTEIGIRQASAAVSEAMQIPPGEEVFSFLRVISVEGRPFAVTRVYLPRWMSRKLTQEDLEAQHLLTTLARKCDARAETSDQLVEAVMADAGQAMLLEVTAGSPLLAVTRRTYDRAGACIEFSLTNYRSDRTRFHISQKRRQPDREDWVLSSHGGRAVRNEARRAASVAAAKSRTEPERGEKS